MITCQGVAGAQSFILAWTSAFVYVVSCVNSTMTASSFMTGMWPGGTR